MKCPCCKKETGCNLQKIECDSVFVKNSINKLEEMYAVCCGECDTILAVVPKSIINK